MSAPQASQAATVSSTMILRRLSPICRFGFGPLLPARSCPSVTAADRSSGSCAVFSRRTTMRMSSRMTKTRITASFGTLPAARSALAASNSSRAARRHHPASTVMIVARIAWRSLGGIFRYSALRFISAPPPMAQPARCLRSKVAHCRSPSFSITTTKRIGLQCQISTKTRSLLYPDIKPEPGGEQLRYPIEFLCWKGNFPNLRLAL